MSRLEHLRKLAADQPDDPFVHYGVGLECMKLERWAEAVEAFDQTLRVDGQYHAAHLQKARAERKLSRRDAARQTLAAGIAAASAAGDVHAADEMRKLLESLS